MSPSRFLAQSWLFQNRRRSVLVIAAVALAISLMIFTVTSYAALLQRSIGFAEDLIGRWDIIASPKIALQPRIQVDLEQQLQNDQRVKAIMRAQVIYCDIEDVNNTTYYDSWRAACIACPNAEAPMALAQGQWASHHATEIHGVLSGGLARRWRVPLDTVLPIHSPAGEFSLRVVGITDEHISHSRASGVFLHPQTLLKLCGPRSARDRLYIDLKENVPTETFMTEWHDTLEQADPPVLLQDVNGFARELSLDKSIKNLNSMSAAASAIILGAALFIVYAAMSAGADERRRQLALLRCVGATRGQVFRTMCAEAMVIAILASVIGVPLGIMLLELVAFMQSGLFGGAVWPSMGAMLLAVLVAGMGVLGAALLPAQTASKTRPLEVLAEQSDQFEQLPRVSLCLAIGAGILALVLNRVQSLVPAYLETVMTATGLVLLGLSAIWAMRPLCYICANSLSRPIAWLSGVPSALLRMERRAQLHRAAAMMMALCLCLGFSVMMNVWGRSMVIPFLPSPQLPDQVISILPSGVPFEDADALEGMPGIVAQRFLPLCVEQTMLGDVLTAQTSGGVDEIYVQILGVRPQDLAGEQTMLPMQADTAALNPSTQLAKPLACIVPDSFARRFNLKIGDNVAIKRCGSSEEINMPIVSLASLPGWQWVTKMGRMRSFNGKPVAPILVSMETARALGVRNIRHWLADTDPYMDMAQLRRALQDLANKHAGAYQHAHFGMGQSEKPSVKIISTGEVARRMQTRSDEVIWVLGAIPLSALIIAILGVINAVAAGMRERQWEFAIMRSVGLEAQQSLLLIIAEVTVVSVLAACVSVFYGVLAAQSAITVSLQLFDTGTSAPPMIIPYLDLVIASVITIAAALTAAYLVGRRFKKEKVISLLQAGRGA